MPDIDKKLASKGVGKVAVGLLRQQQIAKLTLVAAKGGVFIAAASQFSGIAEEIARLPQQVETDIGQRQIDLQLRRVAAPLAQTLGQHQAVIAGRRA